MSITKAGILDTNIFIESGKLNQTNEFSYTPSTGNNSSINTCKVDLSGFQNINSPVPITIDLDLTWTDFTGTGANGTFGIYFQGSNFKIGQTSGVWEGTNYIITALRTQPSPYTLISNAVTGGTYHYSVSGIIPANWFQTYEASILGIRSNYSNGTGKITVSNINVRFGAGHASIAENYINSENFYEY